MRTSIPLLLGSIAIGSVILALSWQKAAVSQTRSNDQARTQVTKLARRLAQLEARPTAERVMILQQSPQRVAHTAPSESPQAPLDPAGQAEQQAATTDKLEARFIREAPNPASTREAAEVARQGSGGGRRFTRRFGRVRGFDVQDRSDPRNDSPADGRRETR